jgi:hypothetical protein
MFECLGVARGVAQGLLELGERAKKPMMRGPPASTSEKAHPAPTAVKDTIEEV